MSARDAVPFADLPKPGRDDAGGDAWTGGCACGAVRYRATGTPIDQRVCHCRRCQRALGSAFNARVRFAAGDVAVVGVVAPAASPSGLEYCSCVACGTTVLVRRPAADTISVTAGSLDDPGRFEPEMHLFTASRQPWLVLEDGLPQHPGAPDA